MKKADGADLAEHVAVRNVGGDALVDRKGSAE